MKVFIAKAGVYLGVMLLLWSGVGMVSEVVRDRLNYKHEAEQSIGQSHAGAQLLVGPSLLIETTEKWRESQWVGEGEKRKLETFDNTETIRHVVLPESLQIIGDVQIEPKRRGIFSVNTYTANVTLKGMWRIPTEASMPVVHAGRLTMKNIAQTLISVSEARGLRAVSLEVDGQKLEIASETDRVGGLPSARASLDIRSLAGKEVPFVATIQLVGTEAIAFLPLGKQNTAQLKSNWPDPAFEGATLPIEKKIDEQGFSAKWQVSSLASEARQVWAREIGGEVSASNTTDAIEPIRRKERAAAEHRTIEQQALSIRMVDRQDIYTYTNRATKYGLLFIALTLAGYALFEVFKQVRIHPLQTLLVGAALVLFFLLLLSLSEQIGFALAYLSASFACVGLIGFYSGYVLGGFSRSVPLTLGLAGLYGALYMLLNSKDNALLLGSVLLFALLAAVMVATRKVNWYVLFERMPAKAVKDNSLFDPMQSSQKSPKTAFSPNEVG
ncbi:MAG: cell envelope integrity protein CreD [Burkholderiaceae bacterium]|nr:cell envelope integrity protein CreD [Burkholderiaceae bacterium]